MVITTRAAATKTAGEITAKIVSTGRDDATAVNEMAKTAVTTVTGDLARVWKADRGGTGRAVRAWKAGRGETGRAARVWKADRAETGRVVRDEALRIGRAVMGQEEAADLDLKTAMDERIVGESVAAKKGLDTCPVTARSAHDVN